MDYQQFVLAVNAASITILLLLALLLLLATKFRGENGIAAAIIVLPNVPIYIHNLSRLLGWHGITLFMLPISFSVNTMLMPLLWFFTRRNFNPGSRFRPIDLLHFIPAVAFLIVGLCMSTEARMENILHETKGDDLWLGDSNTMVLGAQVVGYFTAIFVYIRRRKRFIRENYSDTEYLQIEWIPTLMYLFAALFVIVMVSYSLWPRTDEWLIQILNVIAMSFLVYKSVRNPALLRPQRSEASDVGRESPCPAMNPQQMKEICDQVMEYLQNSKTYANPEFSLAMLSVETGISQKNISRSINGYLNKNFFDLVNEMRVKEAKTQLDLLEGNHTIESVCTACGFNSSRSFFRTFKKFEGTTPSQWLKTNNLTSVEDAEM